MNPPEPAEGEAAPPPQLGDYRTRINTCLCISTDRFPLDMSEDHNVTYHHYRSPTNAPCLQPRWTSASRGSHVVPRASGPTVRSLVVSCTRLVDVTPYGRLLLMFCLCRLWRWVRLMIQDTLCILLIPKSDLVLGDANDVEVLNVTRRELDGKLSLVQVYSPWSQSLH